MAKEEKKDPKKNLDLKNQGSFPKYLPWEIKVVRRRTLQNKRDFDFLNNF